MKASTITLNIALKIAGGETFSLLDFYKKAKGQQTFLFTHTHYAIDYLKFNETTYHRIELCCHICNALTEYNNYDYGSIYLMHNDINQSEITTWNENKGVREIIKNEPKYRRFICLCQNHVSNCEIIKNNKTKQLQLF